ncbi:MAG: 2-oxo acid dehydrogenase subunit E2 [Pseudomonadales bacterium]
MTSIRLSGARGMIAKKMQASLQDSAQLSYHAEFVADELIAARQAWKAAGHKIGYEDLFIASLCAVLKDYPEFNGVVTDNVAELSDAAHVSIAISSTHGLVAPTLFDANGKDIQEIAAGRQDLVSRAGIGKLTVKEMVGGSITISNLGFTRIQYFTPIINTPQLAIIGIGRIEKRPVVDDNDEIVVKSMMGLSLTADHRFVDGEPAGRFLTSLCETLERSHPTPQPT